jgi:hypothetical protein
MRIKKNGTLLATALAIATAVVALPTIANAQHRHIQSNGLRHFHARHFGGVIGFPYYGYDRPSYRYGPRQYDYSYAPQYDDEFDYGAYDDEFDYGAYAGY